MVLLKKKPLHENLLTMNFSSSSSLLYIRNFVTVKLQCSTTEDNLLEQKSMFFFKKRSQS